MRQINTGRLFLFQEAAKYPPLSLEEEKSLCLEYATTKSQNVYEKLVKHNLRLVAKLTSKYAFIREPDLISEAYLGLLEGIKRFDLSKNTKLSTYICYWIRCYIYNFLIKKNNTISLSSFKDKKIFFNLNRTKQKLQLDGEVGRAILAEALSVSEKEVSDMEIFKSGIVTSISDNASYMDTISSEALSPEQALAEAEQALLYTNKIKEFRKKLTDDEKLIFDNRLLVDEEDKMTLLELGNKRNRTKERMRQIQVEVENSFRKYWKNNISAT